LVHRPELGDGGSAKEGQGKKKSTLEIESFFGMTNELESWPVLSERQNDMEIGKCFMNKNFTWELGSVFWMTNFHGYGLGFFETHIVIGGLW